MIVSLKCNYFVTKASHFANHFNPPATRSFIFMAKIILSEQASHFRWWISLWNEAFQRNKSLFAVITLECQTLAGAIRVLRTKYGNKNPRKKRHVWKQTNSYSISVMIFYWLDWKSQKQRTNIFWHIIFTLWGGLSGEKHQEEFDHLRWLTCVK